MNHDKSSRRVAFCSGVVVFGLAAAAAVAQAPRPPIKVGAMIPLTGGGATVGESGQIAVQLAVRNINAAGGIAGRQIQLVIGDYQTEATVGVSEAKRLVFQEKIDLLIGPTYSQVTLAVLPILNEAKIPSANVSGSEKLTPEVGPYAFSMLSNAEAQSKVMVDYAMKGLKVQSAAILSDSGAQAKTAVEALKAELAARNIKLAGVQEYQYRQTDMTPQLLALRRGNPDAILLFTSNGEDTGNMIKSANELGWGVKVVGSFGATFSGPALKIAGKDAYKNVVAVNYRGFSYCPSETTPKTFQDFVASVKAFKPEAFDRQPLAYLSLWYDAVYVLKAAVEGTGGKTDGPSVAAWLEANSKSFRGINSGLSASKATHFLVGQDALTVVYPDRQREGGLLERVGC
ncbi:MAG: ABC transporter substrate-binding protein [Betaproteobacteria bacterium]|nr:ABC transporter substrate-binding protein [Betaproteobacteria bacterium]